MSSRVVTIDTQMSLSITGVEAGLEKYREVFDIEPEALIVSDTDDFFLGQEILEGGLLRTHVARWLPPGLWMLVGTHGIFYSGDI